MLQTMYRFLFILVGSLSVFWGAYFVILFGIDHLIGAQQIKQELLLSPGKLARNILSITFKANLLIIPIITLYGLIVLVAAKKQALPPQLVTLAIGITILATSLLWLGFSLLHILPFIIGFSSVMIFIQALIYRGAL